MRKFRFSFYALAMALAACSWQEGSDSSLVGVAAMAISQVPVDVNCVRINVAGARSVTRNFGVVPGSSPSLLLNGLSLGQTVFTSEAFGETCGLVSTATVPGWVSDPVTANIVAGVVAEASLVLKRNGRAKIGVSFEDDVDGGVAVVDALSVEAATFDSNPSSDAAGMTDSVVSCSPVVNEVSVVGPAGAADEFVELYNPCDASYSLNNHRLVYRSAIGTADVQLVALSGLTMSPRGFLVFGGSAYSGIVPSSMSLVAGLAATGGSVGLQFGSVVLDSVGYGSATNALVESAAAGAPSSGSSIARVPDGVDTNNNAADFKLTLSSAGRPN